MSEYNNTSNHFVRLFKAIAYSLKGLKSAFKYEQAFRLEVYIALLLFPIALFIADSAIEAILLIGSWILVMIIELLNSAIETTIDRISLEKHELSGRAKDIGSAAVMLSVLLALGIWIAVIIL